MKAYDKIPEWNKINFRKPTLDERNYFDSRDDTRIVENLPEYEEYVLGTEYAYGWIPLMRTLMAYIYLAQVMT